MAANKLENYLALLKIRQAAGGRDTRIIGGIFFFSFIATIAFGLIGQLCGPSLYLIAALVVVIGIAFLAVWVRLQIVNGEIELIENLWP